jgi:hypothetical protein
MESFAIGVRAQSLVVAEDSLIVDLSDGRSITVPLAWYPRLVHGTPEERETTGDGLGTLREFIGPIWISHDNPPAFPATAETSPDFRLKLCRGVDSPR